MCGKVRYYFGFFVYVYVKIDVAECKNVRICAAELKFKPQAPVMTCACGLM